MRFSNYSLFSRETNQKGLAYALEHTEKLGFRGVEWIDNATVQNDRIPDLSAARVTKNAIFDKGFRVSCYSLVLNLLAPDSEKVLDRVYRHIEYASVMESPFFHHTIVPGYTHTAGEPSYDEVLERISDSLERIAKRCNEYGITCLYEPQGLYFNGVDGLSKLLSEMKSRGCNVGICGDTGNSLFVDTPPAEIFKAFADDIKHIHVKDYKYISEPEGEYSTTGTGKFLAAVPLGEGEVDFVKCFSYLKDYNGDVSFEVCCDDEEMFKNVEYMKTFFKV